MPAYGKSGETVCHTNTWTCEPGGSRRDRVLQGREPVSPEQMTYNRTNQHTRSSLRKFSPLPSVVGAFPKHLDAVVHLQLSPWSLLWRLLKLL